MRDGFKKESFASISGAYRNPCHFYATCMFAGCSLNHKNGNPGTLDESVTAYCDGITFTDITASAGITWRHCNGAFGGVYFPEIKGSGCAIIDYNNDGWPDLLLVNCMHWPGHRTPMNPRWRSIATTATGRSPT